MMTNRQFHWNYSVAVSYQELIETQKPDIRSEYLVECVISLLLSFDLSAFTKMHKMLPAQDKPVYTLEPNTHSRHMNENLACAHV